MAEKSKYNLLSELEIGDVVDHDFLVADAQKRSTQSGSPYLTLVVRDRSDSMKAVLWTFNEAVHGKIRKGDFVHVSGTIGEYNNAPQIKVEIIEKIPYEKLKIEDFVPTTPCDREKLWEKIRFLLNEIHDSHLRALVMALLDDGVFVDKFSRAPAGLMMHQPYIGGLLEHTHNCIRVAKALSIIYPHLDRELLVAGAFLHDIGKIVEYEYDRQLAFTSVGRLKGHLVIGVEMLNEAAAKIDGFPPELLMKLEHMILSHHGLKEWGSPVEPMFAEANLLHFIDNLDAKTYMFHEATEKADDDDIWSEYSRQLGRYVYLGEDDGAEQ
ncbi:MAG: 3'-5' exoribonuclease YhaM family protein [Planctomycetota bacterium]|jgi:3'-5' exoribonuclease